MIANGFNIPAIRVSRREDLQDSLLKMLAAEGPYLLEISVEKEGNVFPMVEPGSSVAEVRLTY